MGFVFGLDPYLTERNSSVLSLGAFLYPLILSNPIPLPRLSRFWLMARRDQGRHIRWVLRQDRLHAQRLPACMLRRPVELTWVPPLSA